MKIVYCLNSIRTLGGIQKVTIQKANALAEIAQNDVYLLVTDNSMCHVLTESLSSKVHLIDLKINYYKYDYKSNFFLILSYLKIFLHWKRLQQQINKILPDVIISTGQCEKYIIPLLFTRAVKIREIHSCSNYRTFFYSSRVLAKILDFIDYKLASKGYDKIVLLTQEDKDTNFSTNKKFIVMPNPLACDGRMFTSEKPKKHTVISVGRLEKEKDYLSLIRVWKKVHHEVEDWNLEIVGEGSQRGVIEKAIEVNLLSDSVSLLGYSNRVNDKLMDSSIFVLTSQIEGFGLVILEAMNAGLPVVAYSCPFGPKDIINEGINGFLIENRDEELMAKRILYLIKNQEARSIMSQNCYKRASDFSLTLIIEKWMELFKKEITKNE